MTEISLRNKQLFYTYCKILVVKKVTGVATTRPETFVCTYAYDDNKTCSTIKVHRRK